MKKIYKLLTLCLFMGAVSLNLHAQTKQTYLVKAGDTFFSISQELDVTVTELKEWNNIDSNTLEIGQELIYYIPQAVDSLAPTVTPVDTTSLITIKPNSTNTFYLVKSGDSLYKIALDNDMTIAELKAINNLTSDNLRIGQRLAIKSESIAPVVSEFSSESTPQGRFVLYTLESGDDLAFILDKFEMTKEELKALNPEINLDNLSLAKNITVLLPPSRDYPNPYLDKANLQDLGTVSVSTYPNTTDIITTTNGELYNPEELTAAHSNISLGTIIYIENALSGRGIYVRINDRITEEGLKLSATAYRILGFDSLESPRALIYTDS